MVLGPKLVGAIQSEPASESGEEEEEPSSWRCQIAEIRLEQPDRRGSTG